MYRCNDCGAEFETPIETDDLFGCYTYDACPDCASDDILCDAADDMDFDDDDELEDG